MTDIEGYEGMYAVNRGGQVWAYPKTWETRKGCNPTRKGHWLKFEKMKKGYLRVHLCNFGETRRVLVHVVVARTFIPNPKNLPQVNHLNGIKDDNRVENLEWCTNSENISHAYRTGLEKPLYGKDWYRGEYRMKKALKKGIVSN